MKWKTCKKLFLNLFTLSLILGGCTEKDDIIVEETTAKGVLDPNSKTIKAVVQVGIPGTDVDSRMLYDYVEDNGKKAIKLEWAEDDAFIMNLQPVDEYFAYEFRLTDGVGTKSGTFECDGFYGGKFWYCLLYFPSSKVRSEKDFLAFSYLGQVQRGNDNLDHLKDYHTIRVDNTVITEEGQSFDESLINFVGDNVQESSSFKFNLKNLPEIVPVSIDLMYINPNGAYEPCFYQYNVCPYYSDGSYTVNTTQTSKLTLGLENFEKTTSITAYMMLSNATVSLKKDGALGVCVTDADGRQYYCEKKLSKDATLVGGRLNAITCQEWEEVQFGGGVDGMENPENGIVVLQEAKIGKGVDIIIMGDGFAEEHFSNGNYDAVMYQAADAFFSVEPYTSLRDYFNVYYIKAVSDENHDAVPYWSGGSPGNGAQNGATMGTARTKFSTQLVPNSTSVSGNDAMVQEYMMQTIRYKGGKGGTPVSSEDEVRQRAFTALAIVQVNVKCYAGTCWMWYTNATDYCNSLSIAYTPLGNDSNGEQCRLTTIHEAGGHGFGKLADEYQGKSFTEFNTSDWNKLSTYWNDLRTYHTWGVDRNVNEYWTEEEAANWSGFTWEYTTDQNVYWAELLRPEYSYSTTEGLSLYKGGNTFNHMFCRSTYNSVMSNQFGANGQSFNAISRWAIWYRIMKLAGATSAPDFKSSLNEFIAFDRTIQGWGGASSGAPIIGDENFVENKFMPLAPPVVKRGEWINGHFVEVE